MDVSNTALDYARAMFMLTEEVGTTERVREEALAICELLSECDGYTRLLDTPALSVDERLALVDEAFSSFDTYLVNLIKLLVEGRMAHILPRVLVAYEDEYMEARGIVRCEAITAVALSAGQTAALKGKLEKITGKEIIINNKIDPSILGGIKIRYMGIQVDGSVKCRLDEFRSLLDSAVI